MIIKIIIHVFSFFWIISSAKLWRKNILSTPLFLIFLGFLCLCNLSLYYYKTFDKVSQAFGIENGASFAFFIAIITLYLLVKNAYVKIRKAERNIVEISRSIALEDFKRRNP